MACRPLPALSTLLMAYPCRCCRACPPPPPVQDKGGASAAAAGAGGSGGGRRSDDPMHSAAMGRALKIMERMANQNAEDEIYGDFRYWEDASDQFRDNLGTWCVV